MKQKDTPLYQSVALMAVVGAGKTDSSRFERGVGRLRAGGAGVQRLPAQCHDEIPVTYHSTPWFYLER